jgi:hypothetical protein
LTIVYANGGVASDELNALGFHLRKLVRCWLVEH